MAHTSCCYATQPQKTVGPPAAEAKYGKLIQRGIFRSPKFIPGTERKTLPIYGDFSDPATWSRGGQIGYIDEQGSHYYEPQSIPHTFN